MLDVRKIIRDAMRTRGVSDRALSLKIGKGEGYIHDFLQGRAKNLPLDMKVAIAGVLDMPASKLAANAHEQQVLSRYDGISLQVFQEDAEPYTPPPGSIIKPQPNIMLLRLKTNVLELHPRGFKIGQVLGFNISRAAIDSITTLDPERAIVVCQIYDKADLLKAETVIRQYIRPGLLVTNRRTGNEAYSLDDPALPFEPRIKGVFEFQFWDA
jgi:hypothetical protein